jgi:hypothetical protein
VGRRPCLTDPMRRLRRRACGLASVLAATAGLVACGGGGRSQSAFCSQLRTQRAALVAAVTDAKGVKAMVDRYKSLDRVAPEAIRDQWHELTLLVERAAAVDPSKPADASALTAQAFASSPSAQAVVAYARATCGVSLPVAPSTTAPKAPPTTH